MCERGKKLACMQKCMAQTQTSAVEEMQTRATKPLAGGVERLQWRYRKLILRKALSGAGGPGLGVCGLLVPTQPSGSVSVARSRGLRTWVAINPGLRRAFGAACPGLQSDGRYAA
jgi:hypothetical protein